MNIRPARVLSDAHSTRSCPVHHFMEPTYPCVVPITHIISWNQPTPVSSQSRTRVTILITLLITSSQITHAMSVGIMSNLWRFND